MQYNIGHSRGDLDILNIDPYIPDQFADNYGLECIIVGHDMGGTNAAGYAAAKYWPYFWINLAVVFFLHTRWFLV